MAKQPLIYSTLDDVELFNQHVEQYNIDPNNYNIRYDVFEPELDEEDPILSVCCEDIQFTFILRVTRQIKMKIEISPHRFKVKIHYSTHLAPFEYTTSFGHLSDQKVYCELNDYFEEGRAIYPIADSILFMKHVVSSVFGDMFIKESYGLFLQEEWLWVDDMYNSKTYHLKSEQFQQLCSMFVESARYIIALNWNSKDHMPISNTWLSKTGSLLPMGLLSVVLSDDVWPRT